MVKSTQAQILAFLYRNVGDPIFTQLIFFTWNLYFMYIFKCQLVLRLRLLSIPFSHVLHDSNNLNMMSSNPPHNLMNIQSTDGQPFTFTFRTQRTISSTMNPTFMCLEWREAGEPGEEPHWLHTEGPASVYWTHLKDTKGLLRCNQSQMLDIYQRDSFSGESRRHTHTHTHTHTQPVQLESIHLPGCQSSAYHRKGRGAENHTVKV